jgi:hypothetical protein
MISTPRAADTWDRRRRGPSTPPPPAITTAPPGAGGPSGRARQPAPDQVGHAGRPAARHGTSTRVHGVRVSPRQSRRGHAEPMDERPPPPAPAPVPPLGHVHGPRDRRSRRCGASGSSIEEGRRVAAPPPPPGNVGRGVKLAPRRPPGDQSTRSSREPRGRPRIPPPGEIAHRHRRGGAVRQGSGRQRSARLRGRRWGRDASSRDQSRDAGGEDVVRRARRRRRGAAHSGNDQPRLVKV